jgi:DNA-binding transcriptional ArsR family regulator
MDAVFKALADASRRHLLDALRRDDGQTLSELSQTLDMSRQAVSKHLGVLERAGLVLCHRVGRAKHHYLNPVPIRQIGDRWISRYARAPMRALADLESGLGAAAENEHDQQA